MNRRDDLDVGFGDHRNTKAFGGGPGPVAVVHARKPRAGRRQYLQPGDPKSEKRWWVRTLCKQVAHPPQTVRMDTSRVARVTCPDCVEALG